LDLDTDTGFPRLSAPARRALAAAGYTYLDQLAKVSEAEIKKLHGMGPTALRALRSALHERGLDFQEHATDPSRTDTANPSVAQVHEYLRHLEEPKRGTLEALRRMILELVPEAEQVISYRVPAFRLDGKIVAGFAAFKDHLSYLPFSGDVLNRLRAELDGYTMTKSALHFPVDRPLPRELVKKLIDLRLADIERRAR
jgi:uncharacterized protein YdhG (YjbR/CyaY superfamily)